MKSTNELMRELERSAKESQVYKEKFLKGMAISRPSKEQKRQKTKEEDK